MHGDDHRTLRVIAIWVLLAAVLSACASDPMRGSYERLRTQPEANLIYPNSELLADGGYDAEWTFEGPKPGAVWKIFGSDAAMENILVYYETELRELGWEPMPGIPSTTEIESWRWLRGDMHFRLGHKDTEEWYQRLAGSERYPTLYEIRLGEPGE